MTLFLIDKLTGPIREFLQNNPIWTNLFFVAIGLFLLIASIRDWNWIFGEVIGSSYNLNKVDGWVNLFGRKTARIMLGTFGVLIIIGAIAWGAIYALSFL